MTQARPRACRGAGRRDARAYSLRMQHLDGTTEGVVARVEVGKCSTMGCRYTRTNAAAGASAQLLSTINRCRGGDGGRAAASVPATKHTHTHTHKRSLRKPRHDLAGRVLRRGQCSGYSQGSSTKEARGIHPREHPLSLCRVFAPSCVRVW